MFTQNVFFFSSFVIKMLQDQHFEMKCCLLSSRKIIDGLIIKDSIGNPLKLKTKNNNNEMHLVLRHVQNIFGEVVHFQERLDDDFLAKRIIDYIMLYYGKRKTNCATLVEYLRTGVFLECSTERNSFMSTCGMNRYSGETIRKGDTLCVMYYNRKPRSRKYSKKFRNHHKEVSSNKTGELLNLKGDKYHHSADQLLERFSSGFYHTYHFLFCIGIKNGQPIFVQQLGRNDPKVDSIQKQPIVISVGTKDLLTNKLPAWVFIKRGER